MEAVGLDSQAAVRQFADPSATALVMPRWQAWHAKGCLLTGHRRSFFGRNGRVVMNLFGEMNSWNAVDQRRL
jgi:hypothetical protein